MLLTNAKFATFALDCPYGLVTDGALVVQGSELAWVGPRDGLPAEYRSEDAVDLEGRLVTPGLIDCHTHLVHGGHRAAEFEMRLDGASYESIAQAGGGIISTVAATRQTTESQLLEQALRRVDALIAEGVTTVEIKSGYGLDLETELKMLRVAREIGERRRVHVRTSFLGAHAVPEAFRGRADDYLKQVVLPTLDRAHQLGLVDAVDGFCERIAFMPAQMETVFLRARELGLPVKLHAEQRSNLGGAQLVARFGGLSADHLEYASQEDVNAMAAAGTVAVMLPGAYYTLRETQLPPVADFRAHGVPMAVATDCNPGSSPLASILLAMNMACTLFRMTPEEALAGATRHAARALGIEGTGKLSRDAPADLAIWDVDHPAELSYRIGYNSLWKRMWRGQW